MNILLIKANTNLYASRGTLVNSLFEASQKQLSHHHLEVTDLTTDSWNIDTEVAKLKNSDLIIYLFPLWWFGVPAELKSYFDHVLRYEETFVGSDIYGEGGQLKHKQFMLVVTTNLDKQDLGNAPILKPYHHVDDILTQIITTNHYIGIRQQVETFHADNVVKGDTTYVLPSYQTHLQKQGLSQPIK